MRQKKIQEPGILLRRRVPCLYLLSTDVVVVGYTGACRNWDNKQSSTTTCRYYNHHQLQQLFLEGKIQGNRSNMLERDRHDWWMAKLFINFNRLIKEIISFPVSFFPLYLPEICFPLCRLFKGGLFMLTRFKPEFHFWLSLVFLCFSFEFNKKKKREKKVGKQHWTKETQLHLK